MATLFLGLAGIVSRYFIKQCDSENLPKKFKKSFLHVALKLIYKSIFLDIKLFCLF